MTQLMKRTFFLTTAAIMLVLVLAMAQPAGASWLLGPGACTSRHDDVTTLYPTYKPCSGCIVVISGLGRHTKILVIDFKKSDYTGPVRVAVIQNDSRLGDGVFRSRILGNLENPGDELTDWTPPTWHGLKPGHYYAAVIYGEGEGHSHQTPFFRQCFLTASE